MVVYLNLKKHCCNAHLNSPTNNSDPSSMFELKEVLGKGAFAAVYRAVDKFTGKSVAIKLVRLEKTHGTLDGFQACCDSD